MIIYNLIGLILSVLTTLFQNIHLPEPPEVIYTYIDNLFDILSSGLNLLNWFLPVNYLLLLSGITILITIGIGVYQFIMWILAKIPTLNIH